MSALRRAAFAALLVSALPARVLLAQPAQQGSAPVLKVVVANQQAASASILADDGTTMKHVSVGAGPHEVAVSPDGRTAVVTIYGTQAPGNQLAVIDLVSDSVVRTIDLGSYTRPHGAVFLGGSNSRVAVTSEATQTVILVDLASGTLEAVPTQARGSHMVAVSADGRRAWTGNVPDASVSELDLASRTFVRSFEVPSRPEGIAVTPNGGEVWVGSNDTGAVTIIDTHVGQVVHTLTGATFPYRLAASPDGARMVVVDAMAHTVRVADVAKREWIGTVELEAPRGAVIDADGRTAYVTQAGGRLAILDLVDLKVVRTLAVQASPDGVGAGLRR